MTPDAPPELPTAAPAESIWQNARLIGLIVLALGFTLAGVAGYGGYKAYNGSAAPVAEKDKDKDKKDIDTLPPVRDASFTNYVVIAANCALWAVGLIGVGVYQFTRLQYPDPTVEARTNRVAVLVVGAMLGSALLVLGLWFFVGSVETLTKWIDGREAKDKWVPLAALLTGVVGAGVAFLASLPARADERADQSVRRAVYGSNVIVSGMLLFLLLVAGNVIAGAKLPNRIDTTNEGFFSLQPSTVAFLRDLDQPVTAHVLMPESGLLYGDARRLIAVCAETNPEKFRVVYYNHRSAADIRKLKAKFPQIDAESDGVVLAAGADESKYSQVSARDFLKQEGAGENVRQSFQGEAALMKELVFLAENKQRAVVYFTQGSGELSLGDANPAAPRGGRAMTAVKAYFDKQNIDARPLAFDGVGVAKVPDDATVVVVADPLLPLPAAGVAAIKEFLTAPKKGKLVVASSPHPTADRTGVSLTGLEELLAEYNIGLVPVYQYGGRPDTKFPPTILPAVVDPAADNAKIGPARTFAEEGLVLPDCRSIELMKQGGNPAHQTVPVLVTVPGWVTWQDETREAEPDQVFRQLFGQNPQELRRRLKATQGQRVLAAASSDMGKGRVFVVASGNFLADPTDRRQPGAGDGGPFLATTIDWLRERKDVPDVVSKPFGFYVLPVNYDPVRLYAMPIALVGLAVVAVGAGVWAVRRK